jgi:phosphatidylserine/phosphatidylglycerophosphate/cardiolipin synthase-like enzyme
LSELRPFVTRSVSSGEIRVFFSRSVDPSYSNGFTPNGQSPAEAVAETINRINAAQQTIDVAMYNNNRSDLTNALKSAYTRGVKIRYVASKNVTNSALNPLPAFPVIFVNDATIMHNKFMVIDAAVPDKAWVMTGSMNWTNTNINNDFNNLLFIQDQSLAKAYMIEFEEMWGSSGDTRSSKEQKRLC